MAQAEAVLTRDSLAEFHALFGSPKPVPVSAAAAVHEESADTALGVVEPTGPHLVAVAGICHPPTRA